MKKILTRRREQGIALLMVLIALALVTMLGLAIATTTTTEVTIARGEAGSSKGYYYAEVGLNMATAMLKRIRGDFNDLLAGPDGIGPNGDNLTTGMRTHGNEFVLCQPTGPLTNCWPTTSDTLGASLFAGPMFAAEVKGFMPADATSPNAINPITGLPGDGSPELGDVVNILQNLGYNTAAAAGTTARWAGKLEFTDKPTNSIYRVLIEVYDDDDPYAKLFNAWPSKYPNDYTGTNAVRAPIYKVPGADASNDTSYNQYDDCEKDFVECAGDSTDTSSDGKKRRYGSFSGQNRDRNARVLVRATARQIRMQGSTPQIVSEVVIDSIVGFLPYPAVINNGCGFARGQAILEGAYGGIHANAGLCLGDTIRVAQSATASTNVCVNCPSAPPSPCPGSGLSVCGFSGANQARLEVPDLNPLPAITDPAPTAPQTPALADTNVNYATSGWFWINNAKNITNGSLGADLIFLSKKGNAGSQRTRRHGTSSSEDGLLKYLLGMTETQFETWCLGRPSGTKPNPNDMIVIDRTSLSGDMLVASLSDLGVLSSWYKKSDGSLATGLSVVGWTKASDTYFNSNCANQCSACTPPPVTGPSRQNNGDIFINTATLNDSALQSKIYYFDGNVVIEGNPGTDSNPIRLTIITTGWIDIGGAPNFIGQMKADLSPYTPQFTAPQIIFLAGTDILLRGDTTVVDCAVSPGDCVRFEGIAYAREQVALIGSATYAGQIVSGDYSASDNKVCYNVVTGNAIVRFNGGSSSLGTIKSSAYRRLKY